MVFLLRAVLTSALFFVNVKTLKQRVDFSVLNFFRHTICPIREDRLCGFYYAQKTRWNIAIINKRKKVYLC